MTNGIEWGDVFALVTLLAISGAGLFGVARYILNRVDKEADHSAEAREKIRADVSTRTAELHKRIDAVKEDQMSKADVIRHMEKLEGKLDSINKTIQDLMLRLGQVAAQKQDGGD